MGWEVHSGGNGNGQGGGGDGGGKKPTTLDDLIKKMQNKKGSGNWLTLVAILVVLGIWLSTCVYTIDVDETGVVQRFGEYTRSTNPGLNFKLPVGIETVTKVKTKFIYKEEFGFRTLQAGRQSQYAPDRAYLGESLMLAGDLNVAVVPWIVQFRITNERDYLFKVRDVQATLRDLSEATMRLVVGDRSINEVISKREEIANQAERLLQKELDEAETGINIVTIEMKKTNVPEPVQPSFNEVNQAMQEKEKVIYQAKEAYNKAVPAAKGNAEKTIRNAEGYAIDRINSAQGDVSRFIAIYKEYNKAKEITKRRLYLETMKKIIPALGEKVIVDEDQKNLLPFLDINKRGGLGK